MRVSWRRTSENEGSESSEAQVELDRRWFKEVAAPVKLKRLYPGPVKSTNNIAALWRCRLQCHSSPIPIVPLRRFPNRISRGSRPKYGSGVGMFSCYGAPRRYKRRIGMGNLGRCTEDVGYRVRRCAYHRRRRQSAKPLRRLQPSFDGKKWQILCPSAKGSFHDSTILQRSNSRDWNPHLSSPPLLHGFITSCYNSIVVHLATLPPISRLNYPLLVFGSRKWWSGGWSLALQLVGEAGARVWSHFWRRWSGERSRARYLVSSRRMGLGIFLCHGISGGDKKGREWVIWAGMWRALAIGLDWTHIISIFEGGDSGTE